MTARAPWIEDALDYLDIYVETFPDSHSDARAAFKDMAHQFMRQRFDDWPADDEIP